MNDIPQEIKEALNNTELQETVQNLPGSMRFKAMALGMAAFQYLKAHEKNQPPELEKQ